MGVYNFITEEELLVEKAENSKDFIDIKNARDSVNSLIECDVKRELQDRLNNINTNEHSKYTKPYCASLGNQLDD